MARQRSVSRRKPKPETPPPPKTAEAESAPTNPSSLIPDPSSSRSDSDYLPARMINEVTYCPRLFYYEHVEGVFVENRETIEGSIGHKRVDGKEDALPAPEELAEGEGTVRSRCVTLASDTHGVLPKWI